MDSITRAESLARNKLINWTTRRNDLPLSERRSKKYRDKKKKILKLRKSIIKKETAITKKKQRAFTKQRKREELQEQKKLRSVSRRDEISWSKKILAKHSIVIPDSSKLIPLRVDHKTILYVKPGADVEAILKMYQKKAS
jgi:hypothetical protein